jgi:catechol-2,3-dioxygenase
MNETYDRRREDLGNSIQLEHLNLAVPDQQLATQFYISALGFTRDPYLVTGLENMWVNIGRNQIHLPTRGTQVLRGRTGLVVPDLDALGRRLTASRARLTATRFDFDAREDFIDVTCPWGNVFRCHRPDRERFGDIALGMPYIAFDVPSGAAAGIARFYQKVIGAPASVEKSGSLASATVTVGAGQHLVFSETGAALPAYDGHHIQLYLANFSGPHRQLTERGLVTEESNQHQYRFQRLVDPESGELLYELEHEIRSVTHPLYGRPLVNRNPEQSNQDYRPGHDAASWTLPHRVN